MQSPRAQTDRMSRKAKSEQLLDELLAEPEWYATILLAQLPAREILPLLKQVLERRDKAVLERVRGHNIEEVPELLKRFRESRFHLLEVELGKELLRRRDQLSFGELLRACRFLTRYIDDIFQLLRSAAKSFEPKEQVSGAKVILPRAMRRRIARSLRRPGRRSPRSSAQQIGSHASTQRPRPSEPKEKTTKQSQTTPHGSGDC
jgi:hypothetical protein